MVTYSADIVSMQDSSAALRSLTQRMREALAQLDQAKDMFVAANAGAAIEEYHDAQMEWNRGLREMDRALQLHAGNVLMASESYERADINAAGRIAQR